MVDLFFYRDPDEIEKDEEAAEATTTFEEAAPAAIDWSEQAVAGQWDPSAVPASVAGQNWGDSGAAAGEAAQGNNWDQSVAGAVGVWQQGGQ